MNSYTFEKFEYNLKSVNQFNKYLETFRLGKLLLIFSCTTFGYALQSKIIKSIK